MFENFKLAELPRQRDGSIYVFFWVSNGNETPFYVGETEWFERRMEDYHWGEFQACTDFKIREAVEYLKSAKQCDVLVRYKQHAGSRSDRRNEEAQIIRDLKARGVKLLNDFRGYNYRIANEHDERLAVQRFCDTFIEGSPSALGSNFAVATPLT